MPDDSPDPTVVSELEPNGRLGRQVALLAADADVPVTWRPPARHSTHGPRSPPSSPRSRRASPVCGRLPQDQVLGGPFVPLDLPSALAAGLNNVSSGQARGIAATESVLGIHIDPSIAAPGPLDVASVRLLQDASVRQLVIDGDALTKATSRYTPARPAVLADTSTDGAPGVTVVATDAGLQRFLTGTDSPALRAAHLLAAMTIVAGEQPSLARGVAFMNPLGWDADAGFVSAVFAGLRSNPVLRATTVAELLSSVPMGTRTPNTDGDPAVRQLAPASVIASPLSASVYQDGQRLAGALKALLGTGNLRTAQSDRALAASLNGSGRTRTGDGDRHGHRHRADRPTILAQVQVPPQSTIHDHLESRRDRSRCATRRPSRSPCT